MSPNTACAYFSIKYDEPDETFQSVLCLSFLSYSSVAAVCVFRTAWECNQGVWSLSFFWVSFLFLFWLWNETLCLVTPFVSHLGGFYTDTQLIFPILFFLLCNYYSSHLYILLYYHQLVCKFNQNLCLLLVLHNKFLSISKSLH